MIVAFAVLAINATFVSAAETDETGEEVCAVNSPEKHFLFENPDLSKGRKKPSWSKTSIDLNGDGKEEMFLTTTSTRCSTQPCPTLIFQTQGTKCFRALGSLRGKHEVLSQEKNGYRIIEVQKAASSKADTTERYIFDPTLSEYAVDSAERAR